MNVRRMFVTVAMALCLALAAGASSRVAVPDVLTDNKIELSVLYAGRSGSSRQKEFVSFLGQCFVQVGEGDIASFKESDAHGYNVVIFDYDGLGFGAPRPNLSRGYTRPTVTVGVFGARLSGSLQLKTSYL